MENNNIWIVALSFLFAFVLSIVALPQFIPVDMGYL